MASGTCASCKAPATKKCSGCLESLVYNGIDNVPTFYCSLECQKTDWDQHKSECKKLQARKTLGRAAQLLQAIFYRIRLHASPLQFKSLCVEGSTISLGEIQNYRVEGLQLKPFPVCLDVDRSRFEAALTYMGCAEAMMYLYRFAGELLAGLCSKVEEVNVDLDCQKLRITVTFQTGHEVDAPASCYHNVYRVTLKNGEVWAVDTTGAQFGYADPLCSWRDFEQQRSSKTNGERQFGYLRHRNYRSGLPPVSHIVAKKFEQDELNKALEEKIPVLAQEYGGKLKAILGGSDAAFRQATDAFLDQLDDHIRSIMADMSAPEQIARRNREVEDHIFQCMANPDNRQWVESVVRMVNLTAGGIP